MSNVAPDALSRIHYGGGPQTVIVRDFGIIAGDLENISKSVLQKLQEGDL